MNRLRTLVRVKHSIRHLKEFFGNCRVLDITPDRVSAYKAKRLEEGAAGGTVNRELSVLKRGFSIAVHAGRVAQRPYFDMLEESRPRQGFFELAEYHATLERLPSYLQAPIRTAYITGWRIASELLTRHKHDVDLREGWLTLDADHSKNEEPRQFPLTPELREVLEQQLEHTRALECATGQVIPWLFHRNGEQIKDFRHAWQKACAAAGLGNKRIPHDFRRTAVRNLERSGIERSTAMKMSGHRTESVYRRYAIVDSTMLKAAAVKLSALHQTEPQQPERVVVPLPKKNSGA